MGKAQQAGNDKAKRKREGRLPIIAQLYRRGYSYRQIRSEVMARLDLDTYGIGTLHNDIKYLLSQWRESRLEDIDDAIQLELQRIDEAVRELWSQWEQSKEQQTETKKCKKSLAGGAGGNPPVAESTEKRVKGGLGDVSYIAEIRKQLMERRKLLGLYAPEKKDISGDLSFASFLVESGQLADAERLIDEEDEG